MISITPVPNGTAGSTSSSTLYDLTVEEVELSSAWNDWFFNLYEPIGGDALSVENLTPGVCSITGWPVAERISSGIGAIRISFRGCTRTCQLDMRTLSGGTTSISITGFQNDTLGKAAWGEIKTLLDAGGDLNLLSGGSGNWDFGSATYNGSCWAASYDFSGVAHKNSYWNTPHFAGTAITDRHVLMVSHYLPPVGTVLTFIAPNGTKIQRTILAYNSGNTFDGKINVNPAVRDIAVAVLSSGDLSASGIKVYPVVGPWIFSEQTINVSGDAVVAGWVGVKLNQDRQVLLCGAAQTTPSLKSPVTATYNGSSLTKDIFGIQTDWGPADDLPAFLSSYSDFYAQSIVGDSGTPRFIPDGNGGLILAGAVTTSSGGAMFPDEAVLNACIVSADTNAGISTGYTVTVAPDPTA